MFVPFFNDNYVVSEWSLGTCFPIMWVVNLVSDEICTRLLQSVIKDVDMAKHQLIRLRMHDMYLRENNGSHFQKRTVVDRNETETYVRK